MLDPDTRMRFQQWATTARPDTDDFALAAAAWMTHAAFVAPERQVPVFDALAGAIGLPPAERLPRTRKLLEMFHVEQPANDPVPQALWDGFWDIAGAAPEGMTDPVQFTLRVVALGTLYDEALIAKCEAALLLHDNVRRLMTMPERRLKTADLEAYAPGTLGAELLAMLRAQGYDLEVIDADTVVLDGWPVQNRTNRLILQLHDIWHLVAGYGFTGAGEVAISGFQLAQFGQNYSTRFLAVTATLAAFHMPPLAEMLLTVALDGWQHGRETPDLFALPWPELLGRDIATLRNELGVRPFDSAVAKMMEGMEAARKAA